MKQKQFESKVKETIKKYKLCDKKDKIVVAMSGGKDSTTVAYLLKKFGYNVHAIHINLLMGKWSEENEQDVKKFCLDYKIPLQIYDVRKEIGYAMCYVKSVLKEKSKLQQCTVCGIIRRWIINKKARELNADKIATGHNLDDEAQNVFMNFMHGNPSLGINLGPLTGIIQDKKFVSRIKPLYFIKEKDVEVYSKSKNFPVLYQRCPCVVGALRHKIRKELDILENKGFSGRRKSSRFSSVLEEKDKSVKENLVLNFLDIQKDLRKRIMGQLVYCKGCGEPSRNEICKVCRMLKNLRSK